MNANAGSLRRTGCRTHSTLLRAAVWGLGTVLLAILALAWLALDTSPQKPSSLISLGFLVPALALIVVLPPPDPASLPIEYAIALLALSGLFWFVVGAVIGLVRNLYLRLAAWLASYLTLSAAGLGLSIVMMAQALAEGIRNNPP